MKKISALAKVSIYALATITFLAIISCGGASLDKEAKTAAEFYCKQVKAEQNKEYQKTVKMRKEMNKIRKKYIVGSKEGTAEAKKFEELFENYKKEMGCQ